MAKMNSKIKSILLLPFLTLFILLVGCRKDKESGPVDIFSYETSGVIGSEGGLLETDNFKITVPTGAFQENVTLILSSTSDNTTFGTNGVSEIYRIEGIPDKFDEELTVGIKYSGTLSGETYMAFGENTFVPSGSENLYTYHLVQATEDDDYFTFKIPPITNITKSTTLNPFNDAVASFVIQLITGYHKPYNTSEGNFLIKYPESSVSESEITNLGEYLENAFLIYQEYFGFSYNNRKKYPINVLVTPMENTVWGYFAPSHYGNDSSHLEFNANKLSETDEISVTAGHEFMHFVQGLYDPRADFWKGGYMPDHHWLNEAVAVWAELFFTDESIYVSDAREGWAHAPFNGFQNGGIGTDRTLVGGHGYGMSAVIKYLVDKYGAGIILEIYERINNQGSTLMGATESPVTTLSSCTENPVIWMHDFFREYVSDNIYHVDAKEWIEGVYSKSFNIRTEADVSTTIPANLADLSAYMYNIRLLYPDIDENAKIFLSTSVPGTEISVFTYTTSGTGGNKSYQLSYLTQGQDNLSISNIKSLTDQNVNLLALATNSRNIPPYTEMTPLSMTITVDDSDPDPGFTECGMQVEVLGQYHSTWPDGSSDYESDAPISTNGFYEGSLYANTFTGSYYNSYEIYGTVVTTTGSLSVTFNSNKSIIESITWNQNRTGVPKKGGGYVINISFTGTNIPLYWTDHYEVFGEKTCSSVSTLTVQQTSSDGLNYSLQSYKCNGDSRISINF